MGYGVEEEYRSGPAWQVVVEGDRYSFVAWLAKRDSGGFDLLLDREACDFEALEADQITHIHKLATTYGMALISFFWDAEVTGEFQSRAVETLVNWMEQTVGFPMKGKHSITWRVAHLDI